MDANEHETRPPNRLYGFVGPQHVNPVSTRLMPFREFCDREGISTKRVQDLRTPDCGGQTLGPAVTGETRHLRLKLQGCHGDTSATSCSFRRIHFDRVPPLKVRPIESMDGAG